MYTFNSYYLSQYKKFIFQFFLLLFSFTSLSVITFNCFFSALNFCENSFSFFFVTLEPNITLFFFMLIQIQFFTKKNSKNKKHNKSLQHIFFFKAYPANQIQVKGLHYHFVQYLLVLCVYVCFQAIFVLDNFYCNCLLYFQLLLMMMVQALLFFYTVSVDANDPIDYNLDFLSFLN